MDGRRLVAAIALLTFGVSAAISAETYQLVVNGEELEFTAAPQRGYVIKLRAGSGDVKSLSGLSGLDMSQASPIRGLDRYGVWTVENEVPSTKNEQHIAKIKKQSHVVYVAPLFTSNGQIVAIIPEIVIRARPGIEMEEVQALCETANCTIKKQMEFTTQEYLLDVLNPDAEAVFAAVVVLTRCSEIEWACPNTAFRPKLAGQTALGPGTAPIVPKVSATGDPNALGVFPNDEYFPMQWHLHNTGQSGGTPGADIRAPEAWEITTGDPNIVVAVIDIGVDSNHPDLVNNLVPGYDFDEHDNSPDPRSDEPIFAHGTECAGLVAAQGNNGIGVTGAAWDCKIMPIRLDITGDTSANEADIATALRWAATNGADILSNSWGDYVPLPIIHSALVDVTKSGGIGRGGRGCVVLFAAGNDSAFIGMYPQKYTQVITVGATDHNDLRWWYSDYGRELDVVAPGGGLSDEDWWATAGKGWMWSTDITGVAGYSEWNSEYGIDPEMQDYSAHGGTSSACPVAAGVAALVLSVDPNLTSEQVRSVLCRSAHDLGDPGWDEYHGWGRVDARAAVELVLNGMPLIYVDDDASNDPSPNDPNMSDPNENGSAEHPFDTIQEAIDYAFPGETIVLLDGAYSGLGNRDIDFAGKAIIVRSQNGPEHCVIDCLGQGRGFAFHSGEGPDAILKGITITGASVGRGAGIQINDSSPTIRECVFTDNTAAMAGGGISITGNSQPTIANCIFVANSAIIGAALNIEAPDVKITNCTLVENVALIGGGAIAAMENMLPELTNCILWNNAPDQVFGGVTATFCNIEGGLEGEGNIDADPLFADLANGEYHLRSQAGRWDLNSEGWVDDDVTSPCIDAGDPDASTGAEPEPNGGRINMGAYGGTPEASKSP